MRKIQGFSLVELSIVLVILGLLVGGVLSGQALIRAAEMRSISADYERYRAATYAFRDKFFAFPGDMSNATQFWGAQDADATNCAALTTAATGTATCNGDGNGRIGTAANDTVAQCAHNYERYRFWQHLSNAGMIEGKFAGVYDPNNTTGSYPCRSSMVGWNIPKSRISKAGFDAIEWNDRPNTSSYVNWIAFGANAVAGSNNIEAVGGVLKPEEAWGIDTKIDDGMPLQGSLKYWEWPAWPTGVCTTGTTAADTYNLSSSKPTCALTLKL